MAEKTKHMDSKPMVLVVDDTETNLDILVDALDEDYDVRAALDGPTALEVVDEEVPDLILLDIMMPGMDGYEVCRRLKSNPATHQIPVIFLTAKTALEDEIKGFKLGAVDYITKPISLPKVQARIKNHLLLQESLKRLEEQNAQLIEAARLREDVDQIMRHDLKSPLNCIIAFPRIIMENAQLDAEYVKSLRMVEESGYRMLNMINLSLDLMKMERGTYPYQPESVDLVELIQKITREHAAAAQTKGIDFQIRLNGRARQPGDRFFVSGESLLCYSLFSNLLKNAVEASPENQAIHISMQTAGQQEHVHIQNAGAVPEEIRNSFFEKYVTCGKSGGTGLGTYSARLIVETQGGADCSRCHRTRSDHHYCFS